jgi:hypothetical protein
VKHLSWVSILSLRLSAAVSTFLLSALFSLPAVAQAPPAAAPKAESLLATADEVFEEMSKLTGLPIQGPLKKLVLSRAEIRKFLEENLDEEYTPQQIHKEEAQLKAFGLVSKDFDLRSFLLSFYTEQAAGAYDPHRKTMFIADWPAEEMQRMVLAHELTHALQDQNIDLVKFMRAVKDNDDATGARAAVMEGHATAAMMQRMIGSVPLAALPSLQSMMAGIIHQQFAEFPAFTNAPYFFRLQALFPYIQGMGFMQAALRQGGWEDLRSVFEDPPTTTKAIYDPSHYFEKKTLPPIALPRPPALEQAGGLRVVSENSFGQLGYHALIGQFVSEAEAKAVAPHWLGDRFIVYESEAGGRYALVARTRWSGPEQTLAFFRDYHAILAKKHPELASDKRSGEDLFIGAAANGSVILLRRGDECLWAEGIPAAQTDAMLDWLRSL